MLCTLLSLRLVLIQSLKLHLGNTGGLYTFVPDRQSVFLIKTQFKRLEQGNEFCRTFRPGNKHSGLLMCIRDILSAWVPERERGRCDHSHHRSSSSPDITATSLLKAVLFFWLELIYIHCFLNHTDPKRLVFTTPSAMFNIKPKLW